jgi:hypothetical protein
MLKRIGVLAMILTAGAAILPAAAQAQDIRYRPVDRDGYGYRYYAQGYGDFDRDRAWREHEYRERMERERREHARYDLDRYEHRDRR